MRSLLLTPLLLSACTVILHDGPSDRGADTDPSSDTGDTDVAPDTDPANDTDAADTDAADTDAADTDAADTDAADTDTDTAVVDTDASDTDQLPAFCGVPDPSDTDGPPVIGGAPEPRAIASASGDLASVIGGLSTFGWNLHRQTSASANSIVSPLSIAAALAMTWDGAEGATEAELTAALGITLPAATWRSELTALLADVEGTSQGGGAQVQLANRLFGDTTWPWRQDFLDVCANEWGAPFESLAFAPDPEPGRLAVNSWASQQTCGLIPELFPPASLTTNTQLVLVNALFAEADWTTEFEVGSTAPADFHLAAGGVVSADFMFAEAQVRLSRPGDFTVVKVPVKGGELGFWIVMPDDPAGLPALESAWTPAVFDGWAAGASGAAVQLYFPRFQQRTSIDLVGALRGVGVTTLFDRLSADLGGMHSSANRLWVDQVQHQATIVFDEVGLRAAAATGVSFSFDTAGPQTELRIDRPFLFVLRDDLTGTVLFMGRTVDPTAG